MAIVNIAGLDKAEILKALYDEAKPLGLGVLHYTGEPMTIEEAKELVGSGGPNLDLYFDYVHGRPLKIMLGCDEMHTGLYDRDQGAGRGERIIAALRAKLEAVNA